MNDLSIRWFLHPIVPIHHGLPARLGAVQLDRDVLLFRSRNNLRFDGGSQGKSIRGKQHVLSKTVMDELQNLLVGIMKESCPRCPQAEEAVQYIPVEDMRQGRLPGQQRDHWPGRKNDVRRFGVCVDIELGGDGVRIPFTVYRAAHDHQLLELAG